MTGSASGSLKARGASSWARATEHPMVLAIGAGALPHATFRYYFSQNILYLEAYARTLGIIVSKAPDLAGLDVLVRFLGRVVSEEVPRNHRFHQKLGGHLKGVGPAAMAPANEAYTRHLLTTATEGDCADGLAAILPCQWSYGELAKPLSRMMPDDPIYAEWIGYFSSEHYDDLVGETTALLDRLVDAGDAEKMERLSQVFEVSTRHEIAFWDMAYSAGPLQRDAAPSATST